MRPAALGLGLLLTAAPAQAQEPEAVASTHTAVRAPADVRNRFLAGLWMGISQTTRRMDLELLLSDALTAVLVDRDGLELELVFSGRTGVRIFQGALDNPRIRAVGLRLQTGAWTVDLGRFVPLGGGWRLADGVQAVAQVGHGVFVGAWAGFGPDPYTTLPALRFGGGPILGWTGDRGEVSLLGEVLGTPDGLDRASGVLRGRVELGRVAEVFGTLDLQAGGVDAPVRLADATVLARLDPRDDVRVELVYDAWSSLSYLVSQDRDPRITRFAQRSQALLGDPWTPQDTTDPTVTHLAGAGVTWRPAVGREGAQRLVLRLQGRYRHHDDPLRRNVNAGLDATLTGLAGGRLEVGLGGGVLWWQDQPGGRGSARIWSQLDRQGRVALDTTADLFIQLLPDTGQWTPSVYADAFLDAFVLPELALGAGYMLTTTADFERWDTWHGAMVRLVWRLDTLRWAERRSQEGT